MKYRFKLDFSDFHATFENETIIVEGLIEVCLKYNFFDSVTNSQIDSIRNSIYSFIAGIIGENYKDPKVVKENIIDFLNVHEGKFTISKKTWKIENFKIESVYNLKQHQRKLKLNELERKNNK